MQAVVAVETGRRNGVPLGIVSDGRRHFRSPSSFARAAGARLRVSPRPAPGFAAPRESGLALRSQVSCAVLDNLSCRAAESGDPGRAIRAAELKLELPFDPRTREIASSDLRSPRARLN